MRYRTGHPTLAEHEERERIVDVIESPQGGHMAPMTPELRTKSYGMAADQEIRRE